MTVVELVQATHRLLVKARVPHAFGGALALGFHATPRATVDVDVNIFLPFSDAAEVVRRFEALRLAPETAADRWMPAAGVRLVEDDGHGVVDLFFSVDEVYTAIRERCVERPFGPDDRLLPILSKEDLIVFKLSFGRAKDWVDLDSLARAVPDPDLDQIEATLLALRGPTIFPRIARFRAMVSDAEGRPPRADGG